METAFYNTYAIPTQSETHLPEQVRSKTETHLLEQVRSKTETHLPEQVRSKTETHLPEQVRSKTETCAVAKQWGKEDALAGLDNNAAAYYIPDSPEWHAYAVGYLHGQRQARNTTQDSVTVPPSQPLPAPPGLWALRGYEDALFERPHRPALPNNATDRNDYLQGYQEGAAMLQRILSAPPPLIPVDDDQPIFYFKSTSGPHRGTPVCVNKETAQ